jgi:tetratricopeptide (TPR) repeat protein
MSGYLEDVGEETPSWGVWLGEWCRTRQYLRLLAALPALLALAGMLGLGIYLLGWRPARVEADVRAVAERAFAGEDFETARVAYRSLLRLGGKHTQNYGYQLLRTEFQLGHVREAAMLTLQLAPPERLGYAPAHYFVAKALLAETNAVPGVAEQAALHLERVLKAEPNHTEAREILSQIYLANGQQEQARRHLLELAPSSGDAMLRLAALLSAEGDTAGTRHWGGRAAQYFRARVEPRRNEGPGARLALASALRLVEDYAGAFEVLRAGWQENHNEAFRAPLARLCAEWGEYLSRHQPGDVAGRFQAVQEGLELEPQNPALLQQLASLTRSGGPEGAQARELVAQMLREGRSTGLLHFCLGNEAWEKGERDKAFEHFRLAYEVAAQMPIVANNMALTLAWQDKPELDRAQAIADSLVQQNPRNPAFRETRGQILLKRGKFRDAIADLAFALPLVQDKPPTHRALAECYRQMGLADLAAQHEEAARAAGVPATNAPPRSR